MKFLKSLLFMAVLSACVPAFAQTSVTGRVQVGYDAAKPASCGSGDQYNTDDTFKVYTCGPNNTWSQIAGTGGLAPGVLGDVVNYATTTTGGDAGFQSASVFLKPEQTDAACYVSATNGNDSNDGLSWGTAKLTLYSCMTTGLPHGSAANFITGVGTIFVYGGTTPGGLAPGGPANAVLILGSNDVHWNNAVSSAVRASNVVTLTFGANHNYTTGMPIQVYNVTGGATSFDGTFTVASTPTATSLTYAQTGGDESATASTGAVLPKGWLKESQLGDLSFQGFGTASGQNTPGYSGVVLAGPAGPAATMVPTFGLAGVNSHYSAQGILFRGCVPAAIGYDSNFSVTTDAGAFATYMNNVSFNISFLNQIGCGPDLIIGQNVLWLEVNNFQALSLGITTFNIGSLTRSGNLTSVTLSQTPPTGGFQAGDKISVNGFSDPSFNSNITGGPNNGAFTIQTVTDATHFTYNNQGANCASACGTGGKIGLDADNDRRAAVLLNTGGTYNSVDMYLTHGTLNDGGGVRVKGAPGTGTTIYLDHINMEGAGLSQPIYDVVYGPEPQAFISDIQLSDSADTPCAVRVRTVPLVSSGNGYTEVLLGNGDQGIPVCGRAYVVNNKTFNPNPLSTSDPIVSPLGKGQTGSVWNFASNSERLLEQVDDVRRNQSPVYISYPNLATSNCSSWGLFAGTDPWWGIITAPVLTPGVTDVSHVTTNACNLSTPTSVSRANMYSGSQTFKSGDGVLIGAWVQSSSQAGTPNYFHNTPLWLLFSSATVRGIGNSSAAPGVTYLYSAPAQQEDGEWQWVYTWDSVNNAATSTPQNVALASYVTNGFPDNVYAPVFIHVPIAQISRYSQAISTVAAGGGFVTYTFATPHQFVINQIVCINDVSDTSFNGCTQIVNVASTTTIQTLYSGVSTTATGGTAYASADSEIAELGLALAPSNNVACQTGMTCNMTGAIAYQNIAQTWTAVQTFNSATTYNAPVTLNTSINLSEEPNPFGMSSTTVISANSTAHWPVFNPSNAGWSYFAASDGTWVSGHCLQATGPYSATDNGSGCGAGGTGTVTNVTSGNFAPLFTVAVSNPGTTPAFAFTASTATANKVYANCTTGTATPSFCSLTGAMLPNPSASTLGGVESLAVVTHNFLTGISTAGVPTQAQPNFTDLAGTISAAQVGLLNPHSFLGNNTGSIAVPNSSGELLGASDTSVPLYIPGGGTANAMVAALTPAATALVAGLEVRVQPIGANTTTNPTLNVNSLGAKTITKLGTAALAAGDYTPLAVAVFIYDGVEFQLMNPQTITGGGATLQTGGVSNISQALLNFTTPAVAGAVAFTNPSGGVEQGQLNNVTGGGNAVAEMTNTGQQPGDYAAFNASGILANTTPGIAPNPITTTYSVSCTPLTGDRGKQLVFNSATPFTVTVPAAGVTPCLSNFYFNFKNAGAGAVTIAFTTSTVQVNNLAAASSMLVLSGQLGSVISDASNYSATLSGVATGTTGTITGTSLTNACDSGTVTINGAVPGTPVRVSSTTGADLGGAFSLRASVTSANTVTVYVCSSGTAQTPASLAYNVELP